MASSQSFLVRPRCILLISSPLKLLKYPEINRHAVSEILFICSSVRLEVSHLSSRILKQAARIGWVRALLGFQTSPSLRWQPRLNFLNQREFVTELETQGLVPLVLMKTDPVPSGQVW